MKSFFSMNFQNGFRPDFSNGFRAQARVLGQDDILNEEISAEQQAPPTITTPPPAPAPVVPPARPPGTSDTDWAKILAEGLKAASSGYGTYTQEQIAKMKAEADILRAKNPSVASILPSDSKTATIALVVGGVAVLGLILVVAIK